MKSPWHLSFFILLLLVLFFSSTTSTSAAAAPPSLPLSTQSRWIVDSSGRRVKLACASWSSHLEPAVAEGLSRQPVDAISKRLGSMGFNCVRFTWAIRLLTDASLGSLTVRQSLDRFGLADAIAGVQTNNPELIDVTLVQALQAVVSNLASNNIMIILDNHITTPEWCCSNNDGNGFFGDKYFDPDEWLRGLGMMATMFNSTSNVVGMSLRNELRGRHQDVSVWYRYMQQGAEVVHAANPRLLVILSGLDYDLNLSFLSKQQVQLTFQGKLVFEIHRYAFSDGSEDWKGGNVNDVCAKLIQTFMKSGGFLLQQGWPLFMSEFGGDQTGGTVGDNRFLSCLVGLAAEVDLDWAVWALQGSYYIREGKPGFEETYGMLTGDWSAPRNPSFLAKVAALQSPFQGPGLDIKEPYNVIFHPLSGQCAVVKANTSQLVLGSCADSDEWIYTEDQKLVIKGAEGRCLGAQGEGQAAMVGTQCNVSSTKWQHVSETGMNLGTSNPGDVAAFLCLDMGSDGRVLTNTCKCVNGEGGSCSPESQWFKIISRNAGQKMMLGPKVKAIKLKGTSWLGRVWCNFVHLFR